MYYIYGIFGPSLLIESTDSMIYIIESVDSISRDGPDIAIYVIHYKYINNSEQLKF